MPQPSHCRGDVRGDVPVLLWREAIRGDGQISDRWASVWVQQRDTFALGLGGEWLRCWIEGLGADPNASHGRGDVGGDGGEWPGCLVTYCPGYKLLAWGEGWELRVKSGRGLRFEV